ncbi:MAG: hypothetical protein N0C84_01070 [Candidatus Thiodiazotropha taylori]|uniref:Terminase large subunit gp17-like C-terminal domain-containing protein n=1 Tax=Candidatus Thiodiazotropha taylori TaxID=2792791 RepID=A0A9E4N1Q7_9GAMM|nr:hypothetical protein [Candidatus Thiodiazotropha taylori]MCW4255037.1 hypothetical protein [Candidatus Thiodiazotropha taylori]
MFKANTKYKIKTTEGFKPFEGILRKYTDRLYRFELNDGTIVKCSKGHGLLTDYGFKRADEISYDDCITGKFIKQIAFREGNFPVYDPVGVEGNTYLQPNGIVSHNTEFIGSGATLISPAKLGNMSYINPVRKQDQVDFYEEPKPGHTYFLSVDCARGMRLDYSAFVVVDVTNAPYKVVAKYRSNEVTPLIYPRFIYNLGKYYNDAHVLIEANDVGAQVADAVLTLGYENMLWSTSKGRAGWVLGLGQGSKLGITTSTPVKRKGCSNLKSLVETDRLIIEDYDIFVELTTFARKNELSADSVFEAEPGCNDDLVMCLVLFSWAVMSDFWKDITNIDIAKDIYKDKEQDEEGDDGAPLGFATINTYETFTEGDDVWHVVDPELPSWFDEVYIGVVDDDW